MFLSIFFQLAILSTLSIAALGQSSALSAECTNALTSFTQETACFGSTDGMNGFLALLNMTTSSLNNPTLLQTNPSVQRALMTFYDNFCTSQACVNSYANVINICFRSTLAQVNSNLDVSLLVDQVVDYACTRNEGGQYCAIAQFNAASDFATVALCSLGFAATSGLSCANLCDAVRRTTSSLGCCINNFFEFVRKFFVALNTPGVSIPDNIGIWSTCNVDDPGTCRTTLSNPLSGSGHRVVHSWWLLAAVLVFVKVILG